MTTGRSPQTTSGSDVSFAVTDEQRQLRSMAGELFADLGSSQRVREVMLGDDELDRAAWDQLAGLGLTGLTVPEALGGSGASHVELAIVFEEAGRRLLPVPLLSSAVLGAEAVLAAATESQGSQLLPEVAAGRTRLALAHLDAGGRVAEAPGVDAVREHDGWILEGTAGFVVDGRGAHVLVTAATTGAGVELFLVPADAPGVGRDAVPVLDLTRPMATVHYGRVHVEESARLSGGDAAAALHRALTAGVVMLANEQIGGAQQVLETTTDYARERVQFGRPIGSFQAVKHGLAQMLVEIEAARSTAYHAARVLADGDAGELAIAAPMAASYCSEVYERVSAQSIQLHGGLGFTWEHDAHLYFKRAKATKLLFGGPVHHRRQLARALGL